MSCTRGHFTQSPVASSTLQWTRPWQVAIEEPAWLCAWRHSDCSSWLLGTWPGDHMPGDVWCSGIPGQFPQPSGGFLVFLTSHICIGYIRRTKLMKTVSAYGKRPKKLGNNFHWIVIAIPHRRSVIVSFLWRLQNTSFIFLTFFFSILKEIVLTVDHLWKATKKENENH